MRSQADTRLEIAVGQMLRIGVSVSAAIVLTGAILFILQAHGRAPDYQHFHGTPIRPASIGKIVRGVQALDSRSIIELGLLLLIATPVLRVVLCLVGFALEKDGLYVAVSSVVLAVLLYSLFFHG
jgi:uncharacterized membrane protein